MKWKTCITSLLAAALLASSLALTGCGAKKEEPAPPAPAYGVADLETLVKAHPKYSTYFKLESEYKSMLAQYQQERSQLIRASSTQKRIQAAMADESARMAAQNELQTKVKAKEDELNQNLEKLYNEINASHKKPEGGLSLEALTPEERAEMANLQMKLTVLGVTGDEKEQVKQKLHELMDQRTKKSEAMAMDTSGWTEEDKTRMQEAKDKASKELDDYASQTAEQLKADIAQKAAEASDQQAVDEEGQLSADDEAWNDDWQRRIKAKQDQMAAVKAEIMEDIRKQAARVASEKNLDMIFSQYRVNINADDVTGDIVAKVVNMKADDGK